MLKHIFTTCSPTTCLASLLVLGFAFANPASAASTCAGFIPAAITTPANLIAAITAANSANCPGPDTIDLGGNTISFTAGAFTIQSEQVALPDITTPLTITNGTLTRSAGTNYKYLHATGTTLTLSNLTVTNGGGNAISTGGAVHTLDTTLTVINSTFAGNAATAFGGGAIFQENGPITITGSVFRGNSANTGGALSTQSVESISIERSQFYGNVAILKGGALHFGAAQASAAVVSNSLIVGNFAQSGGGIFQETFGTLTLRHASIAGNRGGQINLRGGTTTIENAIVWSDTDAAISQTFGAALSVNHSAVNGWSGGGTGNITSGFALSQIFVDPSDTSTSTGFSYNHADYDWRLVIASPAINAGTNVGVSGTDLAGNARIQNGTTDMGAYEGAVAQAVVTIAVSPSSVLEDAAGNLVYTLTRNRNLAFPTVVSLAIEGTASAASDYTGAISTLSIPAGATTASFTIDPTADSVVEANETVLVVPFANGANFVVGSPGFATGTISNDDVAPIPTFIGSINVGPSEAITSLTNPGGMFEAINAGTLSGNVVLNITDNLVESGTHALNPWVEIGASNYTLLIRPSGGPRSITGTIPTTNPSALIRLNGADRVTIDGSTTGATATGIGGNASLRELSIQSTSNDDQSVVIALQSGVAGARNNVIRNVNVLGLSGTATRAGIAIGGSVPGTPGSDNDNNRIENCAFRSAMSGIYVAGQSAAHPNTGTVISRNQLSVPINQSADRLRHIGIAVFNESGVVISDNNVGGISSTDEIDSVGIAVGTRAVDSGITTAGGVTGALISGNRINGVANLSASGYAAAGIALAGSPGAANVIVNNMITDVVSAANGPDIVAGIYVAGVVGSNTRVLHNSVWMSRNRGPLADQSPSYALAITGANEAVELKNNAFSNTQITNQGSGGVNAKSYAIGMQSSTFTNLDANYNAYFSSGRDAGFFRSGSLAAGAGTDYPTVALWRAAIGDDANALQVDPLFVSDIDLHLQAASTLPGAGTPIAGVTVDFDGQARSTSAPSIGADEVPIIPSAFSISDGSVNEGNTGNTALSFTVSRSATTLAQSVDVASVTGGTALAGIDYTALASTTMNFAIGVASQTVSVQVIGDSAFEADETFSIGLSNASNGATISDATGVGTISNDDSAPTLAINDVSITEGNFGTRNLVFTVTRRGLTALPATFTAATANGNATAPSDYLATLTGVSAIAPGGATATTTLTATINGDAVVESNEFFVVNLSSPVDSTILDNQGTGIINNDDAASIVIAQSGGSTNVTEGGATDTYTLVLTSQPTNNVSIALNPGTQVTVAPSPIVFNTGNWDNPQTVTVTAVNDAAIEGNHTGTISHSVTSLDSIYQGATVANVIANITDNDAPGVSIVQSGGTTTGAEGGATDSYTVVLTAQPSADVLVALSGVQVNAAPTSLSFTSVNWNVPQTVTVTALDDTVVEAAHTGSITTLVTSTDGNYSGFSVPAISVAITDNDSATVQFAPVSVGQLEATSPIAFTVTLSNPVASGVTLNVNSATGTATAVDFTAISAGTVSFPANSTTAQTVSVVINNDVLDEADENFSLTLSNIVANGTVTIVAATAAGTILDDDAPPVLSIANVSLNEGNAGTSPLNFVVMLTPVSGRDVSFIRATADGTATLANNDYVALAAGSVTIPAGQTSVTIPVTINGDAVFEGAENFSLNLTAPINATPNTLSATGIILEDDQQPTTMSIVSDLPDPSVVGQSYSVNVQVAGTSASPLGTVNVSDGATTCVITLATATSPNSSGACNLTSATAGSKTLTATYVPASTAFGASSSTTTHQVNAASTTLSLTGPASIALNQPASYSFALAVTAPGAGIPAGLLTVQSGAQSCQVTLPSATTSCAISFTGVGQKAISASFAPSNADFVASSTTANVNTLVFARSDLSVTKTDAVSSYRPNDLLVYTIIVRNVGIDAATQVRLIDAVPASLDNVAWTCVSSGGAFCPAAGGVGSISQLYPNLLANSQLVYTLSGGVNGSPASIVNTAIVQLPNDGTVVAITPANLSATDTNLLDFLFANSFEDQSINAASGGFTLPSEALRSVLDETALQVFSLSDMNGEALRIYSRELFGTQEFALATRDASGRWTLATWQRFNAEPCLSWTAAKSGDGFVLIEGRLQ